MKLKRKVQNLLNILKHWPLRIVFHFVRNWTLVTAFLYNFPLKKKLMLHSSIFLKEKTRKRNIWPEWLLLEWRNIIFFWSSSLKAAPITPPINTLLTTLNRRTYCPKFRLLRLSKRKEKPHKPFGHFCSNLFQTMFSPKKCDFCRDWI